MAHDERCYAVVEMIDEGGEYKFSQVVEIWDSMVDAHESARMRDIMEDDDSFLRYIVWPTFYGKPS